MAYEVDGGRNKLKRRKIVDSLVAGCVRFFVRNPPDVYFVGR